MIFLFDENIPRQVVRSLQAFNRPSSLEFVHALDHFPAGTPDIQLFGELAKRGWLLVTQDRRMSKNRVERAAILNSGIGVFVLTGSAERSLIQLGSFVLSRIEEIMGLAQGTRPPFIFGVTDRGKFNRLDT